MENLNDVLVFVKVVERAGISAAASILGISPSLVSRRLSQLEQAMGIQLVNRSTRHISLTESGRIFYESCCQALSTIENARVSAANLSNVPSGNLRVHSAYGIGQSWVAGAVAAFKCRYPDVGIDLVIGSDHENLLRDGYDVIVKTSDILDSSLDCQEFGIVRHVIVASPEYLRRAGVPKEPRDLVNRECLLEYGWRPANEWFFEDSDGTYTVKVNGSFRSTSAIAIRYAALNGLGIARLPEYALNDSSRKDLQILFDGQVSATRRLRAFFPRSQYKPAKLTAFLEILKEMVPGSVEA